MNDRLGGLELVVPLDNGNFAWFVVPTPLTDLDEWKLLAGLRWCEELTERLAAEAAMVSSPDGRSV